MGVFSEIAMEQQNGMFDSSAAFEDDEAFELEEMESLPVPPVGTDTVPVAGSFWLCAKQGIAMMRLYWQILSLYGRTGCQIG